MHRQLIEATGRIKCTVVLFECQLVQGIINPWKWEGIFPSYCIQLYVVEAEPWRTILFIYYHYWGGPVTVIWLDTTLCQ